VSLLFWYPIQTVARVRHSQGSALPSAVSQTPRDRDTHTRGSRDAPTNGIQIHVSCAQRYLQRSRPGQNTASTHLNPQTTALPRVPTRAAPPCRSNCTSHSSSAHPHPASPNRTLKKRQPQCNPSHRTPSPKEGTTG